MNSEKQQPSKNNRVKIKQEKNKKKTSVAVWPADRKALALAFLLPSARDLAFSIGWTMERARFAGKNEYICNGDPKCRVDREAAPHTCWLAGENPQSARAVDPLDLDPAVTENTQEKHVLK